jgi:hypothetical protein
MSFTDGQVIRPGTDQEHIAQVYKHQPTVFLVVKRSKNANLVVYEAVLDDKRNLRAVDIYWLDLEEKYRVDARARGRMHDRDEFGPFDRGAYGITEERVGPREWTFRFNRFPKKTFTLRATDTGASCYDGPRKVHHLSVHDQPALGFLWPKVTDVKIVSVDTDTKKKHTETVKP